MGSKAEIDNLINEMSDDTKVDCDLPSAQCNYVNKEGKPVTYNCLSQVRQAQRNTQKIPNTGRVPKPY